MESAASTEPDRGDVTYVIAPGSQVRAEKGGLLFYTKEGPRLYYLPCGNLIHPDYFFSGKTLREWLGGSGVSAATIRKLEQVLAGLEAKGVVCASQGCP